MWEQYIDGAFKHRALKIVGRYPVGTYGLMEGRMLPTVDAHARERWNGMFRVVGPHLQADIDHDFERLAEWDAPTLTMPPSAYFMRQCFVGAEEERGLKQVVEQIGNENIVWSSDYPHGDSDYPKASEAFLALPVSDETKHKLLWDNCVRLYALR
jgi:hypothetical protein